MKKIFKKSVKKFHTQETKKTHWVLRNKKKITAISFFLIILFASISITLWYLWEIPLLSPLSSLTTFMFIKEKPIKKEDSNKIVYGFLPYWNTNKVTIHPEITHLAYFALTIGGDGFIVTRTDEGTEPGYHRLSSDRLMELSKQVSENTDKIEVVLSQFDNDDIVSLIASEKAHENLLTSLDSILLAYPISGINIDVEYTGEVTPALRQKFAKLIAKINKHLDERYNHVQLSIDMYASAASKGQLWDVEAIGKEVDFIIVMAYDFHRRSSTQAGPVAPLFGGQDLWSSDINHHLKNFLDIVPKEKILLGVPFYGYGWQTTSKDAQANTYPGTGSTATYKRVLELLANKEELGIEEHWHETALSPYITYTEDGETYVIYYENARSIAYKLDYVNQLDLPGIAIWALGYEGGGRELWDVVGEKF